MDLKESKKLLEIQYPELQCNKTLCFNVFKNIVHDLSKNKLDIEIDILDAKEEDQIVLNFIDKIN